MSVIPFCPTLEEKVARELAAREPEQDTRTKCDNCGEAIPQYPNMQGAGFESCTPKGFKQETLQFASGPKLMEVPIMSQLCHSCYLKDFAATYPDQPLPTIANVKV